MEWRRERQDTAKRRTTTHGSDPCSEVVVVNGDGDDIPFVEGVGRERI